MCAELFLDYRRQYTVVTSAFMTVCYVISFSLKWRAEFSLSFMATVTFEEPVGTSGLCTVLALEVNLETSLVNGVLMCC